MTDLEEAFRTALKHIDEVPVAPLDLDLGAATPVARRRPRLGWLAAAGIAATLVIGTVLVVGRLPIFAPVQAEPAAGAASEAELPGGTPPVAGSSTTSVTTTSGDSGGAVPGPSAEAQGRDEDVFGSARALPDAPQAVRAGAGRVSCGSYVLDQGGSVPARSVTCLAASGGGRELDVSEPTTEGDPIPLFYVVEQQADRIDVYSTDAFDSFGGGEGWTHRSCPLSAASSWDKLSQCG